MYSLKRFSLVFLSSLLLLIIFLTKDIFAIGYYENSFNNNSESVLDSYKEYYDYYIVNDWFYDYLDLYSVNNRIDDMLYRPKYNDVSIPLKEFTEWYDKEVKIQHNAFDVEWKPVNKTGLPTSRALDTLGYDFLLYNEEINVWEETVNNTFGYKNPITAPYFIMNFYKAIGIELYDIQFYPKQDGTKSCGVLVSRTKPELYWKLFMDDHPIDYDIYNDYDLTNTNVSDKLTTEDAIIILAQMLQFYGEPVISEQEEYMLLQVYSADVPAGLTDRTKEAWSYLKCRGIIGEEEYDYSSDLTFDIMMDLLLRAADPDSRTNFKEVQITTSLDDSFVQTGHYESDINIINQPEVFPSNTSIDFSKATRLDFLIKIDDEIAFRYNDTGQLNRSIFISKDSKYNSEPIKGSVFEGIVDGMFYHFSIPITELNGVSKLYLNSNAGNDYPLNYELNSANGGVYLDYTLSDGYVYYSSSIPFSTYYPNSVYVDSYRKGSRSGSSNVAYGLDNNVNVVASFNSDMVDIEKSREVIESFGGTLTGSGSNFVVSIDYNKVSNNKVDAGRVIGRMLVIKDEYKYNTNITTKAILGLTGEKLLINLEDAISTKIINGYKLDTDNNVMIIYSCDGDIIIVDNNNKTIQKGNTYIQIDEQQPLYSVEDGSYLVDFRALYGTKDSGFSIDTTNSEVTVKMFSSFIYSFNQSLIPTSTQRMGEYTWFSTEQRLAYADAIDKKSLFNVPLLYKYSNSNYMNPSEVYLPMSSANPIGNYILYGKYNNTSGREVYYLLRFTPKATVDKVNQSLDIKLEELFTYVPKDFNFEDYSISIIELNDNRSTFINIPGVGWCYKLQQINELTSNNLIDVMNSYRSLNLNNSFLPFRIFINNGNPILVNFNLNYMSEDEMVNCLSPNSGGYNNPTHAMVAIQTLFTNPKYVPTISKETLESYGGTGREPYIYWGTLKVNIDSNGKFYTNIGNLELKDSIIKDSVIRGMNAYVRGYTGDNTYLNPGLYYISNNGTNVTINELSNSDEDKVNKKLIDVEEFFNKFDDLTFKELITSIDSLLSLLYVLIIRVIPYVILIVLTFLLIMSYLSNIKIVNMFCNRVFDPVSILTFGRKNIENINNISLIISMVVALTFVGIIQNGNIEKIILWVLNAIYVISDRFF